jgi:hypothetical protein
VQFELFKGEAALLTFTRNASVDITTWTLAFNLKKYHGDASPLITVVPTITVAVSGIFTVALTAAQTLTTMGTIQSYPWDVWYTTAGSEQLLSYGLLTLLEDVRV